MSDKCEKCGKTVSAENNPRKPLFADVLSHRAEGYISPMWIIDILEAHKAELAAARAEAKAEVEAKYKPLVVAAKKLVQTSEDSAGIVGYHLNGDVLLWEDTDIGDMESALKAVEGK